MRWPVNVVRPAAMVAASAVLAMLVAVVAVIVVPAGNAGAQGEETPCPGAGPFTAELVHEIDARYSGHHMTAAVHDERSGCTYVLRPDQRVTTASVIKIEVYAGVLLRAQRDGRWLTQWEADRVWPMITQSADPPTNALWSSLGGGQSMAAVGHAFGLQDTVPSQPVWGLSTTSARDQVRLVRQVVAGEYGPLAPAYRDAMTRAMESVVPAQRWGIGAGAPHGWRVALKNGFFDSRCCRWRINSAGFVRDPRGGGYSVAILSDGWPDQASGVAAVEYVAQAINATLGTQPYGPFDSRLSFVTRQHRDAFGRTPALPEALPWVEAARWDAASGGQVVDALLSAPASGAGDEVAATYRAFLGRWPEPAGLAHFRQTVRSAGSAGPAVRAIAHSDEFHAKVRDLTGDEFIDLAYRHVLFRDADPTGAAWWRGQLAQLGHQGVLFAMVASPEAGRLWAAADVVQVYDAMLGRIPSSSEIDHWLVRWGGRADLAAIVLMSSEYDARVGGSAVR